MKLQTIPVFVPHKAEITVSEGDVVKRGGTIASYGEGRKNVEVFVGEGLGVSAKEVAKFVVVAVGEKVLKGKVLARGAGSNPREVLSPVGGVVQGVSPQNGAVILQTVLKGEDIASPAGGKVIKVVQGQEGGFKRIEIEVKGKEIPVEIVWGKSAVLGELVVLGEWGTARLEEITALAEGKVVVTSDVVNSAWVSKALALDVAGVVCAGVRDLASLGAMSLGSKMVVATLPPSEEGHMEKKTWTDFLHHSGGLVLIDSGARLVVMIES